MINIYLALSIIVFVVVVIATKPLAAAVLLPALAGAWWLFITVLGGDK